MSENELKYRIRLIPITIKKRSIINQLDFKIIYYDEFRFD